MPFIADEQGSFTPDKPSGFIPDAPKPTGFFKEAGKGLIRGELGVAKGMLGTAEAILTIPEEKLRKIGTPWAPSIPTVKERKEKTKFLRRGKRRIQLAQEKFLKSGTGAKAWAGAVIGEAVPYMANALAAGVVAGPAGAAMVGFSTEGDNAYDEAIKSKATEEEAQRERFIVGTINAAIEAVQISRIMKFAGTGKHSVKAFVAAARQKSLKGMAKAGGQFSAGVLRTSIEESIEEFAQEGVSIGVPAILRDEYPKKADGTPDWWAIGERLGETALGGFVAGGFLGGAGAVIGGVRAETAQYILSEEAEKGIEQDPGLTQEEKTEQKLIIGNIRTNIVRDVVERFPQLVMTQKALETVGNAIAKELGITKKITWKLAKPARRQYGWHINTGKDTATISINRGRNQYMTKETIVHELGHIAKPPTAKARAQKRSVHHTEFKQWYGENKKILRETIERHEPIAESTLLEAQREDIREEVTEPQQQQYGFESELTKIAEERYRELQSISYPKLIQSQRKELRFLGENRTDVGAILKKQETRPKTVEYKKVISPKTENQIIELRSNYTGLGFMNDAEFQNILAKETRGKPARYVDTKNFITQEEGQRVLERMHDVTQRLRVTEPVNRAINENPIIKGEVNNVERLPPKLKDPSRLKSIRYYFQRLGELANQPIYEVFLDLTQEGQLRSRERHQVMELAERLPGFEHIANDTEAMQRVEDWIVSQSTLKDKPGFPQKITEDEIRLAEFIQASFKSYEVLARAGKFFEFFDNREELPQYLKYKESIDTAHDIYNTRGQEALVEYLDTQDWGVVSAGYSPMESVTKKVSTHRMPDVAVGKSRIKERGIQYSKQDRDILQRWYSYMRQMDQLIHLQPRIKSLVRLINDNQDSFTDPQKINQAVSIYLDNLKHTNYEGGLVEEWMRRFYSQAITVRVLADPTKVFRNLLQNTAFSEDRRDLVNPQNRKLTEKETEYIETHVHQASVMMSDWAYVGTDPLVAKKLTKWVQRKTLYPASDKINRSWSFWAKINRVHRAFSRNKALPEQMKEARFSDMQKAEQKTALGILAKDGLDAMAMYVAKIHTDNTHFLYAQEQRSPAEQTKLGKIALNLALFRRAALEKALMQLNKSFEKGTSFSSKKRAATVLVTLLGMSTMVGLFWRKLTGQEYSSYSFTNFLAMNFGGLNVAVIEKVEAVHNSILAMMTMDPKEAGKAIDALGKDLANTADYMIPFYDIGFRAAEALLGSENIDRLPARKLRELIDAEYKSRGMREIDRSIIEMIQFTLAKGGKGEQVTKPGKESAL